MREDKKKFTQIMKQSEFHCGMKLNKLTLIEKLPNEPYKHRMGLFQCECGNTKEIAIKFVLRETTVSCGCYSLERIKNLTKTHGFSKDDDCPEYEVWKSIKKRCGEKAKESSYSRRGIKICDRWKNSFENFYIDMGKRPSPAYSIDRINNDEGYCPENCRWATIETQSRNKSTNRYVLFRGENKIITDWIREFSLCRRSFYNEIKKGKSYEETLEKFILMKERRARRHTPPNRVQSLD